MKILLIRGLDQFIFRGMDILADELRKMGHDCTVKAPIFARGDNVDYDVVIGNSQGAVEAMNRKQNFGKNRPKLIVTIDVPPHPDWKAHDGVIHLNIHGPKWGTIKGARDVPMDYGHLHLSYAAEMREEVKKEVAKLK